MASMGALRCTTTSCTMRQRERLHRAQALQVAGRRLPQLHRTATGDVNPINTTLSMRHVSAPEVAMRTVPVTVAYNGTTLQVNALFDDASVAT